MKKILISIISFLILGACSSAHRAKMLASSEIIGYASNGYIMDKNKEIIGYYRNGYIFDSGNRAAGTYRNGYVFNNNDSIIARYSNDYVLNYFVFNINSFVP